MVTDSGGSDLTSPGASSGGGFLEKILSFFGASGDPEREKKRLLKDIAKTLKKQKFKFYKPKTQEVLGGLARFFYNLYKLLGPAQIFLEHAESSGALKTIVIETYLNEHQKAQLDLFGEDQIRQDASTGDVKKVASRLKEEMVSFFSAFDSQTVKMINATYNHISIFLQLINYDFFFLLKKFDSALPERNFTYSPNFDAINGEYISDDLKDFLSVLHLLDADADWDAVFDIFRYYKGQEVVSRPDWSKALKVLMNVRRSNILNLIVKHIDKDPYYKVSIFPPKEKIVESYLNKLKTQVEMTVQKILQEKRTGKIDKLATVIFGTSAVSRMKYYTEKANVPFTKKMLGGFIYVNPMNYLKAFLLDYVKKDVKLVVDALLIKGKWSTNIMSQQLSESFHHLLEISDRLVKFDEALSEEGEVGSKLKMLVTRSDRDANAMSILKQQLKETNEKAQLFIKGSAQNLIAVAKNLKQCLDDYEKQPHELIVNWKELEGAFEHNIKDVIVDVYKKIYYFIQLLQFFIK